nr:hypothetical protein [Tanacetum cinerariifolium]
MRRVGRGFSGMDTSLFEGMLVPQQAVDDVVTDNVPYDDVADVVADDFIADDVDDAVAHATAEPTTYYYWYKLKLLDNVADSRLRLLEESAAADDKMKEYH